MANANSPPQGSWLPFKLRAVHYGRDTVHRLLVQSLPTPDSKAFIATGNSLATKTNLVKQVESLLKGKANNNNTFHNIAIISTHIILLYPL